MYAVGPGPVADTADQIGHALARSARVLDIGCANGGLLVELGKLGFGDLAGSDPSPVCVRRVRALGFEAAQGWLPEIPEALGDFDCVILGHVLEHLVDVRSAVAAVVRRLRPGGIVYAEVPDASRYDRFLVAPFQDFNTEHINHFSGVCLANLFGAFGCERVSGGVKDIASSADSLTPAVYGFFRHSGAMRDLEPDRFLRDNIRSYIDGSRRLMDEIDAHLRRSIGDAEAVIVWGTGALTMKLLSESVLAEFRVAAFVDNNPVNQGRTLRGARVLSAQELVESGLRHPIVIGSLLHGREIIAGIRARFQLENPLIELRPADGAG